MMTFDELIERYRNDSINPTDKGTKFEKLMRAYLLTTPIYEFSLKDVCLFKDFPAKYELGGHDLGIDLIGETFQGELWAIQCKCYSADTVIDKPAVDSFISISSKSFKYKGEDRKFSCRLFISTTNKWGSNAEEAIQNQNPKVIRI